MHTPPSQAALDAVALARDAGVGAVLGPRGSGLAHLGAIAVAGPDAAEFLHSQLTSDVVGLAEGQGHLSARVTRTGHLVAVLSVHRLTEDRYLLVTEHQHIAGLLADLDVFLFSEQLEMTQTGFSWVALQGPATASMYDGDEGSVHLEGADIVIRRSLTGDPGFLVACTTPEPWLAEARERGLTVLETPLFSEAVEVMRIEAGEVRVSDMSTEKPRLLPETGLEQRAVSYTKGCYVGQEVIARVRTYGSVPFALRALVVSAGDLGTLPATGHDLTGVEGGRVGLMAASTYSPAAGAPVVLAFMDRNHRTPGVVLKLEGGVVATVTLLPLHRAANQAARVAQLYDSAIRRFADGAENEALALLEQALSVDPSFADGYEAIGVILGRHGRYHEAIDFFKRLEQIAPDEPMVNTNLSIYYMKLGDKVTAEDHSGTAMTKQMQLGRTSDDGRSAAEVAAEQEQKRHKDARRKRDMFGMVLEFDPVDPIALYGVGNAYATLGQWVEAEDALRRASKVQKNNSAVWLAYGKALEALDRTADAITTYQQGMEVASRRGDLMPLREMEHRMLLLKATRS
jgi:folate-binding protein YgfZ